MTRILRHRGLIEKQREQWNGTNCYTCFIYVIQTPPRWTNQMWIDHLHKGSNKKRFQYCPNSDGLDDIEIPYNWSEYIHHVGSSLDPHSIIQSGLIAGRKNTKKGRQAVFFTAVNPMADTTKWKVQQDAVFWINPKKRSGKRMSNLADPIQRHYPSWLCTSRLS